MLTKNFFIKLSTVNEWMVNYFYFRFKYQLRGKIHFGSPRSGLWFCHSAKPWSSEQGFDLTNETVDIGGPLLSY